MRSTSQEARIPYLSLALLAQKVIDCLVEYVERKEKPVSFGTSLREALDRLRSAEARYAPEEPRRGLTALSKYEHLLTLNEAWSPAEVSETARDLELLLDPRVELQAGIPLAEKVAAKFLKLENQALWNFERPREPLPRGIRELCKAP